MGIYGTTYAVYGKDEDGNRIKIGEKRSLVPTESMRARGETPSGATTEVLLSTVSEEPKPVEAKKKPKSKSKKKSKRR